VRHGDEHTLSRPRIFRSPGEARGAQPGIFTSPAPHHRQRRMRLTTSQANTIRDTARRCFGADAEVWLFGSRVDDTRRGGDIDLYVETSLETPDEAWNAQRRFLAGLYVALGEQKIDVVVKRGGQEPIGIHRVARQEGVRL